MGVRERLREIRDKAREIASRPKKVLFPDAPPKFIAEDSGTGFTAPTLERQAEITAERTRDPRVGGGGGGGGPAPAPAPSSTSNAQIERARQDQAARGIERQRQLDIGQANKRFRDDLRKGLRDIKNVNEKQRVRQQLTNQLQQEIARAQADARLKRVEEGIVTATTIQTATGGERITVKTAREFREKVGLAERVETPTQIQASKTPGVEFLESKGIVTDKPGGRVLISTVGAIERGVRKIPGVVSDIKSFIKGESEFEVVGDPTAPEGAVTIGTTAPGELKPILTLAPIPGGTIGPAPTTIERIQQFPAFIAKEVKGKFGQIFIPDDPTVKFRDVSVREAAAEISAGLFIRGPKIAGQLPVLVAEELGFTGLTTVVPETQLTDIDFPQTVTVSDQPSPGTITILETESTITPEQLKTFGGFVGEAVAITLAPAGALIGGGAAIVTAPADTTITTQERIEGAFIFGTGAVITASRLRGIRRIAKARKTGDFSKLKERELEQLFLTKPESKLADLRSKKVTELLSVRQRKKLGIRLDQIDDAAALEISTRPGGKTITRTFEPTEALAGKVKETRKIAGKTKTFKGTAEISSSGEYTEVIDLGKGLKKITIVDDAGVGTTRIVKNNKIILEKDITTGFTSDLSNIKPDVKVETITIDSKSTPSKTILESRIKTKSGTAEITNVLDDQGNILISDVKEDLVAKRIKGKIEKKGKLKVDPETGRFQLDEEASGFLDVIQTGPRKGQLEIKSGKESILIKKRVGQEIVLGQDQPLDLIIRKAISDKSVLRKQISPKVKREILEGSERRVVSGFTKPDPTDLTKGKAAREELINIIKKDRAKEISALERAIESARKQLVEQGKKKVKTPKVVVTDTTTRPAIIGGAEPGQALQSQFAGPSGVPDEVVQFVTEQVPQKVVVPPTSQFLTTPTTAPDVVVPLIFDAKLSGRVLPVGGLVAPTTGLIEIQQPQLEITTQEIQQQQIQLQPQLLQQPQLQLQPVTQLQAEDVLQEQKLTQQSKQQIRQQLKVQQKARQKQEQLLEQRFQQALQTQPAAKQKVTFIPTVPFKEGQLQRIAKQVETKPEKFSVFITKKGKDVKTETFTTKESAVKFLKKELLGTIAAGGFVQENGRKLKVEELGVSQFSGQFRRSRVSPFKLIQRKQKRLSGFGETSQIQILRSQAPPKKKGKRKKDPFGFNI